MQRTVVVLGSGPIRIGQGVEFDYGCVHCVYTLRQLGFQATIINNNPETVSTDFDTGDALYFEPVTADSVAAICERDNAEGVLVQFGGQTAINLADELHARGIHVIGTTPDAITLAEDRERCDALLGRLGIQRPKGRAVQGIEQAVEAATESGYPVLVRPSFVLGGRGMEICESEAHLRAFYSEAEDANPGKPVLVDRYVRGLEAELDVISDGVDTLVPGVMEHIERAGVHSGDSMTVYPPVGLSRKAQSEMAGIAMQIATEMGVKGMLNVQFVMDGDTPMVLEVNPRASRTVPYISKVTGVPMVALATFAAVGGTLREAGYGSGVWCPVPISDTQPVSTPEQWKPLTPGSVASLEQFAASEEPISRIYAVKAPVFSFQKLGRVEPALGPEMKSTGEVLGVDWNYEAALYKALLASGVSFRPNGQVILTVNDSDKDDAVEIARRLVSAGHTVAATSGTSRALVKAGIECELLNKVQEGSPNIRERLYEGRVSLMINTPKPGDQNTQDAVMIRSTCIGTGVACVTSIDTARALARALEAYADPTTTSCMSLTEYLRPVVRNKAASLVT